MLIRLTRQMRVRAAIALAVVYSFCLIFPPVAFGFVDGKLATHCLGVVLDSADASNIGRGHHSVGAHENGQHHGSHQSYPVAHVPQQDAPHDHAAMHHAAEHDVDLHHAAMNHGGSPDAPVGVTLVAPVDASHHDDDPQHSPKSKHAGSCCGLFCSVAVATNLQSVASQEVLVSEITRACEENLAGRGPSRIDRPPS